MSTASVIALAELIVRNKKSARTRARMTEARKATGPVRTDPVSFTVEGKPKGKGRPRFSFKGGHAYTPAATVAYERQIKSAARVAMDNHQPMDGPVCVVITAWMPIPKSWSEAKRAQALSGAIMPTTKPDLDNQVKGAFDAMNRVVWHDDSQVVSANLTKQYGERPYLHILARPLFKPAQQGETSRAPISRPSDQIGGHDRPQDQTPLCSKTA